MVDVASVKIWGELVGAVKWDDHQKIGVFEYAPKFIKQEWELSPIKMPLPAPRQGRIFQFPQLRATNTTNTFKGLPGLLADALPDRYGNELINVWLAQQGRPADSMNPVEKLCFIGRRGMGALEFEPAQATNPESSQPLEIASLIQTARQILDKKEAFQVYLEEEEQALKQVISIGTSAGGARPKAVIAYNKETGEVRSGQADAPEGFEHWLLKLDGVSDAQFGESSGWGRIEYAYYLMAKDCGLQMTTCKLLEENGRAHFMTKRFDREGHNTKHHIQTLCGLQHYDYTQLQSFSYEQIFQTMRSLRLDYAQAEQMFRRMVFNILATNCDDHTKNFSFRLRKGQKWELSPAYDICYSFDEKNVWVNQQTLSVNGKYQSINREDLLIIAKDNSIKKGDKIITEINTIVNNWLHYAEIAKVRDDHNIMIQKNLHTL